MELVWRVNHLTSKKILIIYDNKIQSFSKAERKFIKFSSEMSRYGIKYARHGKMTFANGGVVHQVNVRDLGYVIQSGETYDDVYIYGEVTNIENVIKDVFTGKINFEK